MADPTFVTQYREEQIATFEQRYSRLRVCCTNQYQAKGNVVVFQVSGSGSAVAVTRGSNSLIPYAVTDNTQNSCTLVEHHAPFERTGFNIFATQGDMKAVMQTEAVGTLNRVIDQAIIDQLDTATTTTGTPATASLSMVLKARTILGNNNVDIADESQMFGLITPSFDAYLSQVKEYASSEYAEIKALVGPPRIFKKWAGINWVMHTGLTGIGTSSEKCYMFSKHAIGHAANMADMDVRVGYDEKQDLSWARASLFHGAKLLQNSGVVQMLHDGSAYA